MATATSQVTIEVHNAYAKVVSYQGLVPWNEVSEACSFFDAALSRQLYPDLIKELATAATKQAVPPVRLFEIEQKTFPIGLLKRVTDTLKGQGIEVIINDKAAPPEYGFNFTWQGPEPFAHQHEAVNAALKQRYGIVVSPTGSGKSLMQSKLIEKLAFKTLWVVQSVDLVRQTAKFLKEYLGIEAGQFGGGRAKLGTVTVAMAGASLKKCLKMAKEHGVEFGIILVDEMHRTTWKNLKILETIDAHYRYGFSATPFRTGGDKLLLEAVFGHTVAQIGLTELQDKGFLSQVRVETVHIPPEEKIDVKGATWEEVYQPGIVRHKGRNDRLVEKIKALVDEGRQVIVDVEELDHIDELDLESQIEKTAEVTGADSASVREDRYEQFRQGALSVLVGTVLREGIDLPSASAVVLAGGKKSKIRVLQEIGRGLRTAEGKTDCVVVDTIDQQHYLLFQHCQQRFRTMMQAGFSVPPEAIRKVQIEIEHDSDDEIAKLRHRQTLAKAKRMSEQDRKSRKDKKPYVV